MDTAIFEIFVENSAGDPSLNNVGYMNSTKMMRQNNSFGNCYVNSGTMNNRGNNPRILSRHSTMNLAPEFITTDLLTQQEQQQQYWKYNGTRTRTSGQESGVC
jgi:hypothetical protein